MWKYKLYVLLVLTSCCQIMLGQEQKQPANQKEDYIIPFLLTDHNNISVQAILNNKDTVHLMFHTAANALTLTEEATQKLKSLNFNEITDSIKSWGGQDNSSRLSKGNSLQIGEMEWQHVPVWENKNSGQNTDGKFGTDLFENKVIEIDFDKSIIVIHTNLPRKIKKFQKLKLTFENDNMFIEAGCQTGENILKNKFLIHSGYAGAILFDDKFIASNSLSGKLKITGEKELKDSFGNVLKTKKAILPALQIGNEKLLNVPAGFFEGAIGRQKISIMGGDILKRFNIIIDAQRAYVYLKANHLKNIPYSNI